MVNLLNETIEMIEEGGYKWPTDVAWVEDNGGEIPLLRFIVDADEEYDAGYGINEVSMNLRIVMKDGSYLEREEYDGSECWAWRRTPKLPDKCEPFGIWDSAHKWKKKERKKKERR